MLIEWHTISSFSHQNLLLLNISAVNLKHQKYHISELSFSHPINWAPFTVLINISNKLNVHYLQYLKIRIFSQLREDKKLPCEQRFLSCMSFNVYEVVCVACLSHSWFVSRQTSYTNYFKLCSMSDVLLTFFRRVTERQTNYTNYFKLCSMSDVLLMFFRRLTEWQTSYMNYFKLCSMSDVLLTFFRRLTEPFETSYICKAPVPRG